MKAVFLLQTDPYLPKPVVRALREANTLRRQGWDVVLVSWIKGAETPAEEPPRPYPVKRVAVPVPPLGTSFVRRALAYNRATNRMFRACVDEKPDLIVAHDFEVLRAAAMAKRRARKPLIYDSHEDWPSLIAENSALEARIAKAQEKRLCRRVAAVITVSEPIAEKFRKMRKSTTVLYNARASSEIHRADREGSRAALGYSSKDFVVGFAGALGQGRGLEVLLEAVASLPTSVKALVVGGPEEEAARLRQRAESAGVRDRLRLDGYRPFAELAPYYASMDLGVILLDRRPNHERALPNKLFDYMAHGVSVLVPDYPAMRAVVRNGPVGWTVQEITPTGVAEAVREVRTSGDAGARGARGREAFLQKYSWDNQASAFQSVVDNVMSSRPEQPAR